MLRFMSNIICVHSYKGGTGKTLIAINLAIKLSQNYRVLLIEADYLMPCFFQIFAYEKPIHYYNEFYSDSQFSLKKCICKSPFKNLDLIYSSPEYNPKDRIFSMDQKWHLNRLRAFLTQLRDLTPKYDYVIIDSAPGRNFVAISTLILSNLVLVILRSTEYSVIGTKAMLEDVYQKTKPGTLLPCLIVLNQVPQPNSEKMKIQIAKWERLLKADLRVKELIVIPLCLETALETALGEVTLSKGVFAKRISQILELLTEKIFPS
jgi:cellulose biosynthesis protein BcsQ